MFWNGLSFVNTYNVIDLIQKIHQYQQIDKTFCASGFSCALFFKGNKQKM